MRSDNHNKIIKKTASVILKPHGIFQQGQSRVWVDDNGWYLTIIEFQPYSLKKGSFLNVGVCFLWSEKDYVSFDIGHRISDDETGAELFVEYNNDEDFYAQIMSLAETALVSAIEYRRLFNLDYAKETVLSHRFTSEEYWGNWNKLMICLLTEDLGRADQYLDGFVKSEPINESLIKFRDSQLEWLMPILSDSRKIRERIIQVIMMQREFYRQHGLKNLRDKMVIL